MIDDRFDHKAAEPRLYEAWEKSGAFKPSGDGKPYAIVIPPPNVTGVLHMGHALNNTLQDVLIRYHRMKGYRTLWQPGTDHAGIATQMVVERELAKEGNLGRRDLGREKFLERVWAWKEVSGGSITNQLKRLGASCDWSRERFTLDKGLSEAVTKVFVELYQEGLIYRDKRLVNWDPQFQTAISDLEVETREVKGHFWHLRYPLADGSTYKFPIAFDEAGKATEWEDRDYIVVATTRPETMLGDTAVAVHPTDERYAGIVGKQVKLPLTGRLIPIVADDYADPTKGTGAVKITPAHDFNDYQVGKRHKLPMINIFKPDAHIKDSTFDDFDFGHRATDSEGGQLSDDDGLVGPATYQLIPEKYRGLERFAARKQIVADIEAAGLLHAVEDTKIMQPFGDRSQVVIEPYLTDQWYVDAATLAKPAIAAVEKGETRFVPGNWDKTYYEWMRNIEPWCVSRQLWWGHRIPVWYGPKGECFVAHNEDEALAVAKAKLGPNVIVHREGQKAPKGTIQIVQDEDVLDTWFSSGLWPFSTMGWPGDTDPALKEFYPGAVLVTAFDIIFFWVARMMMQGIHFMGEVPFKDVYIHALVRDEKGQKMSKSKGNVIDPLELVDEFGADALRMTLAAMAAQGRDIKLAKSRVEGYRNFSTKLWNATKFAQMNGCELKAGFDPGAVKHTLNKWVVSEAVRTTKAVEAGIAEYKFNDAAGAIYGYVWNVVCDWYIELTKPIFMGSDEAVKEETRATMAWALDQIVHLLHPFMPYVTEQLFQEFGKPIGREGLLISQSWPALDDKLIDAAADAEVNWVIRLITAIRSTRSDLNVPAGAKVPFTLVGASAESEGRLKTYQSLIERLARLESVSVAKEAPKGAIRIVLDEATACIDVAALIDLKAEIARLEKEIARHKGDIAGIEKKLSNEQFVAKAPPEVIEEQHTRRAAAETALVKLGDALVQLKAAG
ncbi:MAG: valine--tRNA ligase [Hyphomonadaceae bacterium]|nr:valine--tRNA ligase [Hyphomonadaceae bacterium]